MFAFAGFNFVVVGDERTGSVRVFGDNIAEG